SYFVPRSKVNDACTRLAKTIDSPSYDDVKACYEGIKYDANRANALIDVVEKVLSNLYIFYDQAKEEPKKGFSFKPIDLGKRLNLIRKGHFKSDFEFITVISDLISQLRDAHTHLDIDCYNRFIFSQRLFLYSEVTRNKVQKIK
ncbi:11392_t:CDS:2, partial [Scutellospora calospora]